MTAFLDWLDKTVERSVVAGVMLLTSFVGIALAAMSSAPSKEPKFSESPHLVQSMQLNEYLLGEFVRAENQEQNDMALVDRIFVCRESDHGSMLRVSYVDDCGYANGSNVHSSWTVSYVGEDIIVTLDR